MFRCTWRASTNCRKVYQELARQLSKIATEDSNKHFFQTASHAAAYAKFRPNPPSSLIEKIVSYVKEKVTDLNVAVDVGCGTGQGTRALAPYFSKVCGYDVSEAQVKEAIQENKYAHVVYGISPAEKLPLENQSVQLITASQCAHWFDLKTFYEEVDRVLVPNGVVALYGYLIPCPEHKEKQDVVAKIVDQAYMGILKEYWTEERVKIDSCYKNLELPYSEVFRDECFEVTKKQHTVEDYINYIITWSAFQKLKGIYPDKAATLLNDLRHQLMEVYGKGKSSKETEIIVLTHFFLLLSRKPGV